MRSKKPFFTHLNRLIALLCSILLLSVCTGCHGQSRSSPQTPTGPAQTTLEPFENSAFTYIGMPTTIEDTDTSAGWKESGQKLYVHGRVFQQDGKTPAAQVLLYYYQTNVAGRYVHKPGEPRTMAPNVHGQTHGYIRGWVRTNALGEYHIYTVRPGVYPTRDAPAHIHITVKEPNDIPEYYIDDIVFDDDTLVNAAYRSKMELRGGLGIVSLKRLDSLQVGTRAIQLGLHIPGYGKTK
jgi:protocatechuate 3,4-dioxygenase, beta subunit